MAGMVRTFDIDRDRVDLEVADDIAQLVPDASQYTVLLMKARKKVTPTREIIWFDEEPRAIWTQAAQDHTDADTNIVVSSTAILAPNELVKVTSTDEVIFVKSITNETTFVGVRGFGLTSPAAIPSGAWLLRLTSAMPEGSSAPDPHKSQPAKHWNWTQIVRTTLQGSRNSENERLRTNMNERKRLQRYKALEHRMALERQLLFGERKQETVDGQIINATGGLLSFIQTNIMDINGILTEKLFYDFAEMAFQYSDGDPKVLLASPRVGSIINQFAVGKITTSSGEDTYGIKLKQFDTFHGTFYIVTSKALEKDYQNIMVAVDMKKIYYRPYVGADTKLRLNIHDNDFDGWKDEYMTEMGLEVRLEKYHALAVGITG